MDWITRDMELRARALQVLGAGEDDGPRKLRYSFHLRMMACHPDRNPRLERAQDLAALVNEAFMLLTGKRNDAPLLQNDGLVQLMLDKDPESLIPLDAPTYEEWLKDQFVNMDGKSIWAY